MIKNSSLYPVVAGKPTQKFYVNFQKEISEQIKDLKIDQLMRLFVAILDILSISNLLTPLTRDPELEL